MTVAGAPLHKAMAFLAVWILLFAGLYARGGDGAGALLRLARLDLRKEDHRRLWISAAVSLGLAAGVTAFLRP